MTPGCNCSLHIAVAAREKLNRNSAFLQAFLNRLSVESSATAFSGITLSIFLFHVVSLIPAPLGPTGLGLALGVFIGILAYLGLNRPRLRSYDEVRAVIYQHVWYELEGIYRKLCEAHCADVEIRAQLRHAYRYFLTNGRLIETSDRDLIRHYLAVLSALRFLELQPSDREGVVQWEPTSQAVTRTTVSVRRLLQDANQIRSALRERIRDVALYRDHSDDP